MSTRYQPVKTIEFCIFFILISIAATAQINTRIINYKNTFNVKLEDEKSIVSLTTRINWVNVIDARDDTTGLGYYSANDPIFRKDWPKIYHFDSSTAVAARIQKWVSNYLKLSNNIPAGNNLLIVIKKLWLSSEAALIQFDNGERGQANEGWDAGVVSKFEFYLQRDSIYYPLFRVDSTFSFKENLPKAAGDFITTALKNSLNKLPDINFEEVIAKRRKLSINDILASLVKKTAVQILNIASYKKGVYKSFEEFKTNSPSITEYELRKGQMGDILYVKENNTEYPERKAWGFCDGNDIYINSGDKYSKLIKFQNTFYFEGIKGRVKHVSHDIPYTSLFNLATNTGRKVSSYKVIPKFYEVDMETGEVY